ncbi:MAG: MBL fold metallo-hydrolase [Sphingobium phenoxybenzoativorans]
MMDVSLGELRVRQVAELDLALPLDVILPGIGGADLARLKQWYWDDALSLDPAAAQCALSMHSYLVEIDGKKIIIDTCNGNHKDRTMPFLHRLTTPWLERLGELGVAPEDIDMVLFTHLHVDHVGWNTRLEGDRWVPTFPNARYVFGRRDLDYFSTTEAEADLSHQEAFRDSVLPILEAGLADIVEEDAVLHGASGNGVWLRPAFGHTPGCCTVHARRGGPPALFSGDILLHPAQIVRPDLHTSFDRDEALAAQVRQALIEEVADTDTVIFPAHFMQGAAGRIERDGEGFRYRLLGETPPAAA